MPCGYSLPAEKRYRRLQETRREENDAARRESTDRRKAKSVAAENAPEQRANQPGAGWSWNLRLFRYSGFCAPVVPRTCALGFLPNDRKFSPASFRASDRQQRFAADLAPPSIARPRAVDLLAGRARRFSLDALVTPAENAGLTVRISATRP
jgi:hypothetical protein